MIKDKIFEGVRRELSDTIEWFKTFYDTARKEGVIAGIEEAYYQDRMRNPTQDIDNLPRNYIPVGTEHIILKL